jgi:hypothetical protein
MRIMLFKLQKSRYSAETFLMQTPHIWRTFLTGGTRTLAAFLQLCPKVETI